MGRFFLCLVLCGLHQAVFAQAAPQGTIVPPGAPKVAPPKHSTSEEDAFSSILQRREERLREDEKKREEEAKTPFTLKEQIQELRKEVEAKNGGQLKPIRLGMNVSFVVPKMLGKGGGLKSVSTDYTAFYQAFYRFDQGKADSVGLWTGVRIAPITGTARYKNVPGRFGFLYFGPMLGVGKFSPLLAEGSENKDAATAEASIEPSFMSQGWLWTGGLALLQRSVDTMSFPNPGGEFAQDKIAIDGTGLWTELTYALAFLDTLSTNAFIGAQTGKGRVFAYGGVGVGFWY